jgi:hypothetical protein
MSHKEAQKTQKLLCLIGILLLAVAFRAYGVWAHPAVSVGDAEDYHGLATRLVEGRGYVNAAYVPTAWRPPGYPVFLAGVYKIAGVSFQRATVVQVIVGGLTVLMLTALGAMILDWPRALIAGVIAAVYPAFVWLPRLLLSENLSLFLLLLSLGAMILYLRTSRMVWIIVFGVLCALNTLVRGANLFLPIVVAFGLLIVWLRNRGAATEGRPYKNPALQESPSRFCRGGPPWPPHLIAPLLAMTVAFIVTLLPWTIRNYLVFHQPIPIATQDGLTLYGSYFPPEKNGRLIWGTLPGHEDPAILAAEQIGNEVSASRYLNQLTLQRLRENPGFFFRLIPSKLASLLVPLDWEIFAHAPGTTRSLNVGYLFVILPTLLGFIRMVRERAPYQWLLWIVPGLVLLQSILFYGSPRFRLPAELIAMLPAAAGVSIIWEFFKQRVKTVG